MYRRVGRSAFGIKIGFSSTPIRGYLLPQRQSLRSRNQRQP